MTTNKIVGKNIKNHNSLDIVTGKALYCTDMVIPGMLYGKVLRSNKAHAKILHIDTSEAVKLPGVKCILTGKDLDYQRYGEVICDKQILSFDTVRFIGDPIAAVAAVNQDIAEQALDLIKVKYEELPSIFDPEEAMNNNPRVIVHPALLNYDLGPVASAPDQKIKLDPERPNVCKHYKIRHGDIGQGFRQADEIIENRYSTARIQACAMEPHGAIAQWDNSGRLTIYSGRQLLFASKEHICGALALEESRVRLVSSMHIGGSFGSKSIFTVELIAAVLSKQTQKPVKIILSREEVFCTGGTRIPMVIYLRDGVKRDGTIVAREARVILNAGAYAVLAPVLATNLTYAFVGTYRIPHMNVDTYAVYTNEPEAISFRGFASSQPIWAVETQMDVIAEKLGMSPTDIRRKNILGEGEENAHGEYMHSTGARQCLERVAVEMHKNNKFAVLSNEWKRGTGIAVGNKYCFPGVVSLGWVKVHPDGTLEVRHSADNFGQGACTAIAQIAADVFNTATEKVHVYWGDTDFVPFSTGTISQSSTYNIGKAVLLAAEDAKEQVLERAVKILGVAADFLTIKDGVIYVKSDSSKSLSFSALFRKIPAGNFAEPDGEIIGKILKLQPGAIPNPDTGQIEPADAQKGLRRASFYGHAAQAAEVLINIKTGQVIVTRLVLACDMGYPINPELCKGQMYGGLIMSLGSTLLEQMLVENGKVLNDNLHDYRVPGIRNVPSTDQISLFFEPVLHKDGPYGAKGMGETVMTPGAPAIGNAIYHACGARLKDLPITAESITALLKQAC